MTFFLNYFSLMSPTWVAEDIIVYLLTIGVLFFFMKRNKDQAPYLFFELVAFVFIYASVFENFAVTITHFYSYGTSLIMIGNVPLSIPLFEYLIFIGGFTLVEYMRIPTWCKPFIIGLFAMLQDLSLDPLSVSQIAHVGGSISGRWQWLNVTPSLPSMFHEPVHNWTGWPLMMIYATICILIGRWWFKKSNSSPLVGLIYPFASMFVALILLLSPLSQFLLWLAPFFTQEGVAEWILFAFYLLFPAILLLVFWRGNMRRPLLLRETWPIFGIFVFLHTSDLVFTLVGKHWNVLWIVVISAIVHLLILLAIYMGGQHKASPEKRDEASDRTIPIGAFEG